MTLIVDASQHNPGCCAHHVRRYGNDLLCILYVQMSLVSVSNTALHAGPGEVTSDQERGERTAVHRHRHPAVKRT